MRKPVKKNREYQERLNVAAMVAHGWSDEYIKTRTPADLKNAYGCDEDDAKFILTREYAIRRLTNQENNASN